MFKPDYFINSTAKTVASCPHNSGDVICGQRTNDLTVPSVMRVPYSYLHPVTACGGVSVGRPGLACTRPTPLHSDTAPLGPSAITNSRFQQQQAPPASNLPVHAMHMMSMQVPNSHPHPGTACSGVSVGRSSQAELRRDLPH